MAKLTTTYLDQNFRPYIPTAMRKVMDLKAGDSMDWYFGTDLDIINLLTRSTDIRQRVIVIVVNSGS